jgi:uroporphyrinogen-III decarboxylase
MMKEYTAMTSRQRMLAAMSFEANDRPPCSFMLYKGLLAGSRDYLHFVERQLEMGLDAYVQIPARQPRLTSDSYNLHGLPVRHHAQVEIREWKETGPEEKWPVLFKEYRTPAGVLLAEVHQDGDWPYGDHVPFLDDYIETRSRKYLLGGPEDLPALKYLLVSPTAEERDTFREEAQPLIDFAREHDLLLAGGWGVGADLVGWVYGLQRMMLAPYDDPDFLEQLLAIIADWNRSRMEVVLGAGVDLYIKRAWYENCDFWSPKTWRKYIYPLLKADAELAHARGARFGYLITSHAMPLLDMIAEAGVDVIMGVDPEQWDLAAAKGKLAGKVCLWGGVNGHMTVEKGTPEEVRAEVETALSVLAPGGGFILSPVDNVREDTPTSRRNVDALIEAWRANQP